ncbi:MAG: M50 family metallopeptidase [Cyclobacteriaceae bacterium]|nr:M50 family metallopeptidase [Cyclobacteriaceae bacterium]
MYVPTRLTIHEAGHAVVAHVLGVPFEGVTIRAEGDTHGRLLTSTFFDRTHGPWAAALVYAAGPAAEKLKFGNDSDYGRDDYRGMTGNVPPHMVATAYQEAEDLLRKHWPKVEALAKQLEWRGTLTHDECVKIWAV